MAIDYTTDALIASAKRRATIPTSQDTFDDDELAEIMNDELHLVLVPKIMAVREDYFVSYKDTVLGSSVNRVEIPWRAVGTKVKDICIVDENGVMVQGLPRLNYTDIALYGAVNNYARLYGFYMDANFIHLYPPDLWVNKYLRIYYFRRPGKLVTKANAGLVVDITGNDVTLDNVPTAWTTTMLYDCTAGRPGFSPIADDQAITAIAGNVLTFSAVPSDLAVGDWVSGQGESPIAQIPYEGHAVLAQAAAVKCVEALGNPERVQVHEAKKQEIEKSFIVTITPRVDEEIRKIVSRKGIFRFTRSPMWPR